VCYLAVMFMVSKKKKMCVNINHTVGEVEEHQESFV